MKKIELLFNLITECFLQKMGNDMVQMVLNQKNLKSFLESNEKFDVCIVETFNIDATLVRGKDYNMCNKKCKTGFLQSIHRESPIT